MCIFMYILSTCSICRIIGGDLLKTRHLLVLRTLLLASQQSSDNAIAGSADCVLSSSLATLRELGLR